jgi:hypothetical protein
MLPPPSPVPKGPGRPDLAPRTGSTLAAQTGATLKEIMSRIGHGSARAALMAGTRIRERDDMPEQ